MITDIQSHTECNMLYAVEEFYSFEALLASAQVEEFRHSHAKWKEDFELLRTSYNQNLANIIFDYTVMVVASEMRYGHIKASHYFPHYYAMCGRNQVFCSCTEYSAKSILDAGLLLFGPSVEWESSFGGAPWHMIAKAGGYKGNIPDSVFIDHCVDLTHNNAIYYNKSGTGIIKALKDDTLAAYEGFLDLKRNCPPEELLLHSFGAQVNRLISRAITLGIIDIPSPIPLDNQFVLTENERKVLSYIPIGWGEESAPCILNENRSFRYRRSA